MDKFSNSEEDKKLLYYEYSNNKAMITSLDRENQQLKTRLVQRQLEHDRVATCLQNVVTDLQRTDLSRIPSSNIEATVVIAYKNRIETYKNDLKRIEAEETSELFSGLMQTINFLSNESDGTESQKRDQKGRVSIPEPRGESISITNLSEAGQGRGSIRRISKLDTVFQANNTSLDQTKDFSMTVTSGPESPHKKTSLKNNSVNTNRFLALNKKADQLTSEILLLNKIVESLASTWRETTSSQVIDLDLNSSLKEVSNEKIGGSDEELELQEAKLKSKELTSLIQVESTVRYSLMVSNQEKKKKLEDQRKLIVQLKEELAEKTEEYNNRMSTLNIKDSQELISLQDQKLVSLHSREVKALSEYLMLNKKVLEEKEIQYRELGKEAKNLVHLQKTNKQAAGVVFHNQEQMAV